MTRARALSVVVALAALGWAAPADAACSVNVVSSIAFGTYRVFDPDPLDTTGYISYRCDQGHAYVTMRISLTKGQSPTFEPRTLRSGADVLQYNLFLDAGRKFIWGDGTPGTSVFTDTGLSLARENLPVFARIPPGQDPRPGTYSDSVTVVIDF